MLLLCLSDDLVIHIGDVHAVLDIVAKVVGHHSADGVPPEVVPRVADVRVIVHCWTTHIP